LGGVFVGWGVGGCPPPPQPPIPNPQSPIPIIIFVFEIINYLKNNE